MSGKTPNADLLRPSFNSTTLQANGDESLEALARIQKLEHKQLSSQQGNSSSQSFFEYENDKNSMNNGVVNRNNQILKDTNNEPSSVQTTPVGDSLSSSTLLIKSEGGSKESRKESETPSSPPNLPENLPLILEAGVQNLKDAAATCQNGKCRFFDASVNKTLLGYVLESSFLHTNLGHCSYLLSIGVILKGKSPESVWKCDGPMARDSLLNG